MRPPLTKRLVPGETQVSLHPQESEGKSADYAERLKLAAHLHSQGINPARWTEAHPAPAATQAAFQQTGRKARENQFEVDGRLYDWSPNVSATPAQAKAITDAYTATPHDPPATRPASVETLVDVKQVPLKHPFGTPHAPRAGSSRAELAADEERVALYRHYAKSGIDPDKAHLGDPLPMFYQGFDDGWIYMPNASTQESADVQKIRAEAARRSAVSVGDQPSANDNDAAMEEAVARHYLERGRCAEPDKESGSVESSNLRSPEERDDGAVSVAPGMDKGERDNGSATGAEGPKNSRVAELQSAIENMPAFIDVIEKLQAGRSLTSTEKRIQDRIRTSLERAGIVFDYTLSDPDQLRDVYAQAQEALRDLQQEGAGDDSEIALAMLTLQGAQAMAGGSFDTVRMMQSDNILEKLSLAFQRLVPAARKLAVPAVTALNVEAAKDGPIDYEAAFSEFQDLFIGGGSQSSTRAGASSSGAGVANARSSETALGSQSEKMDIATFKSKLETFEEVTIHIGGMVLKQHPHTTATDQVLIEEILAVAKERGCDPEPDSRPDKPDKKAIYGGHEDSQSRITDIGQPGHKGSFQPDATMNLAGNGNRGTIYVNTGSTLSDGVTMIVRELVSAQGILRNAAKQLANPEALKGLLRPITSPGHVLLYGKKWGWEIDKIRRHIRRKVEELFDAIYRDCLPVGEPSVFQLDDPGDFEFRE